MMLACLVIFSGGTNADADNDPDALFSEGYLAGGGPLHYLRHLVEDVRPCEGEWGVEYHNGYLGAFQFTPGTWGAAARATGFGDYMDPYHVGRNVAWLVQRVDPGSTGGFPHCWWVGNVP